MSLKNSKKNNISDVESIQKIYRISDTIGKNRKQDDSLKRKTLINKKFNKKKNIVTMETSSFKISNKLTVHGTTKIKKTKLSNNDLSSVDILWQHEEKLKYYQELYNSLPEKISKLQFDNMLTDKEKSDLRYEIKSIEGREQEIEYLSNTMNIVDEYLNMKEKESESVQSFDNSHLQKDTKGKITKYIEKYDNIEQDRLCEDYCKNTNNGKMISSKKLIFNNQKCSEEDCNGTTQNNEGFIICMDCGVVHENSTLDYQISYKDLCDTLIKTNYAYKRINRFNEILSTLQAKENIDIPDYVIDAVKKEIQKESITDYSTITKSKIKYYLKRSSFNNYYEHIPCILNSINGNEPIKFSQDIEDKLREMFVDIQEPFEISKDKIQPQRSSFLSYHYILYKFCELLSLDDFKSEFNLLKIDKLRIQDKIWKEMCGLLDWKYIPTKL